jgi:hypothetical protein
MHGMYHDSEIDAAVDAGALTPSSALALRRFTAQRTAAPPKAERDRHFRYRMESASVVPAVGLVILLVGATMIFAGLFGALGAVPVLALIWWLSRRFAERREGLPTTILFLAWAGNVAVLLMGAQGIANAVSPGQGVIIAGGCASACFVYWKCFRLPVAYAAGLLASLTVGDHVLRALLPHPANELVTGWMLVSALIVFAIAMWWDITDVYRQTIRSDIAYWLHGLAGFKLAASGARAIYGVVPDAQGWASLWSPPAAISPGAAVFGLVVFGVLWIVALAIDRRALVLFGTMFVLGAVRALLGPAMLPVALLLLGGGCVVLSLRWTQMRRAAVRRLPPALRAQLPRTDPTFLHERPID